MPVEPVPPVFADDGRQILPDQRHTIYEWRVLLPVRDALVDAGNPIAESDNPMFWKFYGETDGFRPNRSQATVCYLRDPITPSDWAMLQTKFIFPLGIAYELGAVIRDDYNDVNLIGGVRFTD